MDWLDTVRPSPIRGKKKTSFDTMAHTRTGADSCM